MFSFGFTLFLQFLFYPLSPVTGVIQRMFSRANGQAALILVYVVRDG